MRSLNGGHNALQSRSADCLYRTDAKWQDSRTALSSGVGRTASDGGNTLVIKHAGCVPQCAIAFEKLYLEAGAPAGLYTNLLISHKQSNTIIDDPRIKGVALTGSTAAGRTIAARAGQNLKLSSMELGGSGAFIVLEDADLDHTVK